MLFRIFSTKTGFVVYFIKSLLLVFYNGWFFSWFVIVELVYGYFDPLMKINAFSRGHKLGCPTTMLGT